MDDLISRQAAIDAAIKGADPYYDDSIKDEIDKVLPAEPQIIYCKDCRLRDEIDKEIDIWRPCRAIATPDNFSCIRAESANREVTE